MSIRPRHQAIAPARDDLPSTGPSHEHGPRDEVISLELVRAQRRHQNVLEQLAANGPADHRRAMMAHRRWERRVKPAVRHLRSVGP